MKRSPVGPAGIICGVLTLSTVSVGCAGSAGRQAAPIRTEFREQAGTALPLTLLDEAEVARRLASPLTLASATELAIGNHRAIAKQWALVSAASGGAIDAWKPLPLSIHGAYKPSDHDEFELDILQDISSFAGLGARRGVARARMREAQIALLATSYQVVRDVAWAYHETSAAQAALAVAREALDTASAAAALAQRLYDAGNTTELSLLQAKDAHESMRHVVWQAEQHVGVAKAALARALGVRRVDNLVLADRLSDVPAEALDVSTLAADAAAHNLGVRGAIAQADAAVSARSAATVAQFLPSLAVGISAAYGDEGWSWGPAAAIALPLFGQGRGAKLAAEGASRAALHGMEEAATAQASAVMAVQARIATSHERARHLATTVLPLRQQTVAAAVLQYNAMAQSPFALLAARERELAGRLLLIEATKQYWQAIADADALRRGLVPEMEISTDGAGASSAWSGGSAAAEH